MPKNHKHIVIYALIDPITKELRYIGQTDQEIYQRLEQHKTERNKYDSVKYDWIKHLGRMGLEPEPKRLYNARYDWEANFYERLFIFYWKYILMQPGLTNVGIAKGQNLFPLFKVYKRYLSDLQVIHKFL